MDMQPADFLCDFCRRAWDGTFPMVEGHQGSLICDRCLTAAYRALVMDQTGLGSVGSGLKCTLCLEERDEPEWISPTFDDAVICRRCLKQGAGRLHKDPDWAWRKPDSPEPATP